MAQRVALSPHAMISGALAVVQTPGLAIEVLSSGKKRWRFRRQVAGTPIVATICGGPFPGWTIAAAREWAWGI
ncbi:MAG: Arm DNA-binding domain-containing protein [Novosphingobium sp.]